jgi:hypothetical protein
MVIHTVGLPDIYVVTDGSDEGESLCAGFFVPENISQGIIEVSVPLVINPMWGIPRTNSSGNLIDLDPTFNYNGISEGVENDVVEIHVRVFGDFIPQLNPDIEAMIVYSDGGVTAEEITDIELIGVASNNMEYVIHVPAFHHTALVNLKISYW